MVNIHAVVTGTFTNNDDSYTITPLVGLSFSFLKDPKAIEKYASMDNSPVMLTIEDTGTPAPNFRFHVLETGQKVSYTYSVVDATPQEISISDLAKLAEPAVE